MPRFEFNTADDAPKAYWSALKWVSDSRITVLHDGRAHRVNACEGQGLASAGSAPLPALAYDYAVSEDGEFVLALTANGALICNGELTLSHSRLAVFDNGYLSSRAKTAMVLASASNTVANANIRSRIAGLRMSGDSYHWAPKGERFVMRVRHEAWSPFKRHYTEPVRFMSGTDEWKLLDAS